MLKYLFNLVDIKDIDAIIYNNFFSYGCKSTKDNNELLLSVFIFSNAVFEYSILLF